MQCSPSSSTVAVGCITGHVYFVEMTDVEKPRLIYRSHLHHGPVLQLRYVCVTLWPAPRWLDSSVGRALHRYCRGHGFKSCSGLNFFQAGLSCVHYNCDDQSHLCIILCGSTI